jgi:hypothetical protein
MDKNRLMHGDHIYVRRLLYEHHGIYCGGDRVIHYDSSIKTKATAAVRETSLEDFLAGAEDWGVCPYSDSDPPDKVLSRAESCLGEQKYHLVDNNCEHFASYCKTGMSHSLQVQSFAGRLVQARDAVRTKARRTAGAFVGAGVGAYNQIRRAAKVVFRIGR